MFYLSRRFGVAFSFAFVIYIVGADDAFACMCKKSTFESRKAEIEKAPEVFIAKVVSTSNKGNAGTAVFEVTKVYKGSPEKVITYFRNDKASCVHTSINRFKVGKEFLIANMNWRKDIDKLKANEIRLGACGLNNEISEVKDVLKWLDAQEPVK